MTERFDVAVVGAGLMGSSTAWAAARRGLRVVVIEQREPAHAGGSSAGSARIVRRAYADPFYVRLTGEAFELWRELESSTGTSLLRMTGGLDHGGARDPRTIADALTAEGVPSEVFSARQAMERWPGMHFEGPWCSTSRRAPCTPTARSTPSWPVRAPMAPTYPHQ